MALPEETRTASPPPIPPTMKSYTITSLGAPSRALTFHPSAPVPSFSGITPPGAAAVATDAQSPGPGPGRRHLLLKITHAALNPADLALQRFLPPWLVPFPLRRGWPVPGLDFAGEVVAVSGGAGGNHGVRVESEDERESDDVRVGDLVCGAVGLKEVVMGKGTLAEWVVVESGLVSKVPVREGWGPREAVGVTGIAGQTAVEMVRRCVVGGGELVEGALKGTRVLVNGASGGVGSLVVQVWKAFGGEVVGVCSEANEALVIRLGADEVVDYKAHNTLEKHLAQRFGQRQFDAILDCVGSQALFSNSPQYLKPEGKFITIVGGWSQGVVPFVRNKMRPCFLGGTPRSYDLFLLSASGKRAREVAALVEQGAIKEALIDSEYPMEQLVEAYEKLASGRAKGKIIVKVASS